jgi:hypothetical protein
MPEARDYLDLVYTQQGRTSRAVEAIDKLVEKYGKEPVKEAMQISVDKKRPDFWFLRTASQRCHLNRGAPPATPIYLPDRDEVRNLTVETRDLNCYDKLSTQHSEKAT